MDFQEDAISAAMQSEIWHERALEYGERAWRVKSESMDVVYWDVGNGWSSIITMLPHTGNENAVVKFWNHLLDIAPDGELEEDENAT